MAATIHTLPTAALSKETVKQMTEGSLGQGSFAALVQSYSLSILAQTDVDLAKFPVLQVHQSNVNGGLAAAKGHANRYLSIILPNMISTVSDIDAYFSLQNALVNGIQPGKSAADVAILLHTVQNRAEGYKTRSANLAADLTKLAGDIANNQGTFNTFVIAMNTAIKGDGGVLDSITTELKDYDGKIAGLSVGIALGGLAAIGGVLVIIAGAVGTPFTAGGSTPIIAGGVALLAVGAGAVAGSAIGLAAVLRQKSDALQRQAQLNEQVRVASGLSTGFASLAANAGQAASASQKMANAWGFMTNDLGALIGSLEAGRAEVGDVRDLFIEAARGDVVTIRRGVTTIRDQLTGAREVKDPNRAVRDIVLEEDQKRAA
jgi:non-hemolytic enterotoxin B/C